MILLRRVSTKSRYEQTPRYSCLNVFTRNKSRRNMAIGYRKRNSEQSHNQTLELIHQKTFDPSDQLPSSNEVKQLKIGSVSSTQVFAFEGTLQNEIKLIEQNKIKSSIRQSGINYLFKSLKIKYSFLQTR